MFDEAMRAARCEVMKNASAFEFLDPAVVVVEIVVVWKK